MTRGLTALTLAVALGATTAPAADDPKLPDAKAFDKLVVDSLREVHNKGADLYNTSKDFAGAYRMYQGALVAVRPLLAHRPEAQKIIDAGLAAAEKAPNQPDGSPDFSRKAFLLHEAIEGVRKHLKDAIGGKKPEDKKGTEPKKDDKKPGLAHAPMPKDTAPAAQPGATVGGKVLVAGQPLADGEVTFISLGLPQPRVFHAAVKAGEYKFAATLPPGKYAGMVTGAGVPAKYHLVTTAGLMIELAAGTNSTDLVLK
jgi:hypothetical protein